MRQQTDKKKNRKKRAKKIISYERFLKKLRERELWNLDLPFK